MQPSLEDLYTERIDHFSSTLNKVEKQIRNISMLRLAIFVLSFVLVYYFARSSSTTGIVISIFSGIILFFILVRIHARALVKKNMQKALLTVNKHELKALKGDSEHFRGGNEFNSDDHRYCNDLDIFGSGSLFQYLNRTATLAGLNKLADSLAYPMENSAEIVNKQKAVEELAGMLEWRQKFQAFGLVFQEEPEHREKVEEWSLSKPLFKSWIFKLLIVLIPLLTALMITFLSMGSITVQIFLVYLVIPWGISGAYAVKVNQRHMHVSKTSEMLMKYAMLLQEVEGLEAGTEMLKKLKEQIVGKEVSASRSIKSLSSILNALDNRLNFVSWALLNGLLLWDILQMVRLEKWQARHRDDMKKWFAVIGEFDVISSLANFRSNNATTIFPEVGTGPFEVRAVQAGHPLINAASRVNNDISVKDGEFLIITGANMAGKSTYLRTVGVNLVLAMCGAPVCAQEFRFVPIKIFTSIRTRDSLKENESYFYAELKRLKAIIDELREGKELFIILDEILKGTNSKDKHAGSEALLQQLISFKASGMVATHDVLLGKLSEQFPEHIRNHCFEVEIEGNQLHFDYLLHDGVSKNLNATILMREMGITI